MAFLNAIYSPTYFSLILEILDVILKDKEKKDRSREGTGINYSILIIHY